MTRSLALICLLFLCYACDNDFNSGQRYPVEHRHDYEGDNGKQTLQEKYQDSDYESRMAEGSNRWIWQKPNLIIKLLGPLEDKVIADIGAGPYGYFSLRITHQVDVKKVIAMDIDESAIAFMERARQLLPAEIQNHFESRLVEPNDAKLQKGEADVVLIVNTVVYFEDRLQYFKHLMEGIAPGGKIVIIDFKKRNTPVGPAIDERIALGKIEQDLSAAGYKNIVADDRTLDYQYIVTAYKEEGSEL